MAQSAIDKYFRDRTLVIATRHQKEQVLQPVLEQELGVRVVVPDRFDTDVFGTFSGEIERTVSPLEAARQKCIAAHKTTGESLVLASEGSFGAHPVIGFIPANEEILLLKDFKNELEIKVKHLSTQTNFIGNEYYDWEAVLYFAVQAKFPSHGLLIRRSKDDFSDIHKGITGWDHLKNSFCHFQNKYGKAYIETDMRAMYNPTRMKVIGEAVQKLINTGHSSCPLCKAPGFDVQRVIKGLPCGQCNTPTQSPKAYVYRCEVCGHEEERSTLKKKQKEDPMFCDECNP